MDDDEPFPPHSQSPAPKAAGSLWLVSYADDDDRELTSEQIALALQRGEIELDTIVWRDGMPEWQPIRDLVALRSQLKRHAAANAALRKKQTVLGGFHAHDFFADEAAPPSSAQREPVARAASGPRTPLPPAAPPPRAANPAPRGAPHGGARAAAPLEPEVSTELDSALLQDIPAEPASSVDGGEDSEETLPLGLYRPRQSTLSGTGESPPLPPVSQDPSLSGGELSGGELSGGELSGGELSGGELSLDRPSHASLEDALESLTVDFDPDPSGGQSSRIRSALPAESRSSGVETPRVSYSPSDPPRVSDEPVVASFPLDELEVSVVAGPEPQASTNGDDAAPPTIDVRGREISTSPPTAGAVETVRFEPHHPPAYAVPPPAPRRGHHGLWLVALLVASAGMFTLGREMGQRQLAVEPVTPPPTPREATSALNAESRAFEGAAEARSPVEANQTSEANQTAASSAAASAGGAPNTASARSARGPSGVTAAPPQASPPAAAPGRTPSGAARRTSEPEPRLAPTPSPEVNGVAASRSAASLKVPAAHGSNELAPSPGSNRDDPTRASSSLPEFNTAAAAAALSRAATSAAACRNPDDPKGTALVSVTFSPSGDATRATVEGSPFAGTPTGSCIASKMRAAHVPPFTGSLVTVRKSVVIQ